MSQEFLEFIKSQSDPVVHIILHHNADPDAICAAEALGKLMQLLNEALVYKIYSDDINTSATRIMEEMSVAVTSTIPELSNSKTNLVMTVDTANISQLGKYADWVTNNGLPLIVVDHHDTSEMAEQAIHSIIQTDKSSTCVIAANVYKQADIQPDARVATLLLSGHIYDSRRFLYGVEAGIFRLVVDLIEYGGDYELANLLLQNEMSHGEKIARFKAAQRSKYHIIGPHLVITSKIAAFEASVARSFIGLGADITFILAVKDNEVRASARSQLDLNIGNIMQQLAEEFNGTGGGHSAAAGLNIKPLPPKNVQKQIQNRFIQLVKAELLPSETQE